MRVSILTAVILLSRVVHAQDRVGVVVTGGATTQPAAVTLVEGWLRSHGHDIVGSPLDTEAISTLVDCFAIDDQACARGVIDNRSKLETLVVVRLTAGDADEISITAYWFVKGHDPVVAHRMCARCSSAALRATVDAALGAVAGAPPSPPLPPPSRTLGRLKVRSNPPGVAVFLDNEPIGDAPIEREVAAGRHVVALAGDRTPRAVEIGAGEEAEVTLTKRDAAPAASHDEISNHHSHLVPSIVLGVGAALVITGVVLYATSETDTGEKPTYRDTQPAGIVTGLVGVAAIGTGVYLWLRGGPRDSAPTVAMTHQGAFIGWSSRF